MITSLVNGLLLLIMCSCLAIAPTQSWGQDPCDNNDGFPRKYNLKDISISYQVTSKGPPFTIIVKGNGEGSRTKGSLPVEIFTVSKAGVLDLLQDLNDMYFLSMRAEYLTASIIQERGNGDIFMGVEEVSGEPRRTTTLQIGSFRKSVTASGMARVPGLYEFEKKLKQLARDAIEDDSN